MGLSLDYHAPRQRLVSLTGVLVVVGFLILFKPVTLVDIVVGALGVLMGGMVIAADARTRR